MTDTAQLDALFEQQHEKNQAIINEVRENLLTIFTDKKQFDVIFDMYQQVFKLSNDTQELNHANIFMNSYIDAFHQFLVGEDKLISEEEYREVASQAYHQSLETIIQAAKANQGENVDE